MSTKTAPVDVLAVMDAFGAREEQRAEESEGINKLLRERNLANLQEARAAIAELIEADREYDAALEQRNNPPNKRMRTLQDIEVRWARAICRRATALARVGGGT